MERVQALQHSTYVGSRLWLLGACNTREGVDVVLHEERGARSEADETRSALAPWQSSFCFDFVWRRAQSSLDAHPSSGEINIFRVHRHYPR